MRWSTKRRARRAANLLSASRFALSAIWLIVFIDDGSRSALLAAIAICAALSDVADGPVARRAQPVEPFGGWLDSAADVTFVLTVLICEAAAGALPAYIPCLISLSFAQYAIDSIAIGGSSSPIKSRLGHWGGVINFALVLMLSIAPYPRWPAVVVREAAPLLAAFYIAAMFERACGYLRYVSPGFSTAVSSRLARGR